MRVLHALFEDKRGHQASGVTPYHQTTPEVNTVSLDNKRFQIRLEAHTPD